MVAGVTVFQTINGLPFRVSKVLSVCFTIRLRSPTGHSPFFEGVMSWWQ